ncbi:hypothetical protein ACP0HM_20630 [Escherichia coli]
MPEIFSGTFMSGKAFVARCGVNALSRRFRGPVRAFNVFAHCCRQRVHHRAVTGRLRFTTAWFWLPGGCFASDRYRRRDERWFR